MKRISKKIISEFVIILLIASAIPMISLQNAEAQLSPTQPKPGPLETGVTPDVTLPTTAYISFRPQPVGKGQPFLLNMWMVPPIHVQRQFIQSFVVTLTKPDGQQEVFTMDSYPADGTAWMEYTPDQVGTWKIKFDFLGQYFPAGNYFNGKIVTNSSGTLLQSAYFLPDSDGPFELTVQEEMVSSWPAAQLPTGYWERPVHPNNRDWWTILGNFPPTGVVGGGPDWPAETNPYNSYNTAYQNDYFVPYVQAPESAHVVWKKEYYIGGLIGGSQGPQTPNWMGSNFIYGHPTIIYAGKCYETVTKPFNGVTQNVWQCYDLRTGEIFWERTNVVEPTFIIYESGASGIAGASALGVTPYLGYIGNGRLIKYDPYTGGVVVNASIAPLTTGTFYADPYVLSVQDLGSSAGADRYRLVKWDASGTLANLTVGAQTRIISNVSWPFRDLGNAADFQAGIAYTTLGDTPAATQVAIDANIMAASLETGQLLWNVSSGLDYAIFSSRTAVADQGKFAVRFNDGYWHCWDGNTGRKLWKGELSSHPWGTFGTYSIQTYGGMIISLGYDAVVAYDWDTGKIVWRYEAVANPYESPYTGQNGDTVYSWMAAGVIADGKLYVTNQEHSPEQPVKRGWKFHCIDVNTGEGIWNITATQTGSGDGSRVFQGAVADGYIAISNAYDGYMYVFGKGKSATTVTAPQTAITQKQSIVITGTVLDQSPGQPNTPCVSKESMTAWMEYLHMQAPIPNEVVGVPVSLDAVDPNGNSIHIATVTTDMSGTFGYTWSPDISGQYKITATFTGDDSYGSSWAQTYASVIEAPQATTTTQAETAPDYMPMMYGILIAVIISIIIGLFALFRKR